MTILYVLIPITLALGLAGLAAFFWSLRSGQYEDLAGAAERILLDENDRPPPTAAPRERRNDRPTHPRRTPGGDGHPRADRARRRRHGGGGRGRPARRARRSSSLAVAGALFFMVRQRDLRRPSRRRTGSPPTTTTRPRSASSWPWSGRSSAWASASGSRPARLAGPHASTRRGRASGGCGRCTPRASSSASAATR